ncbi:MAG: pyrroline-5-carboxylate reductase [Clostridia bacterium]|nr:pyrroline-5-carboxylate reductase [Clostridia bacterium]
MYKIAFLGAGNMGGAMIRAIVDMKAENASNIYVYDRDTDKLKAFAEAVGVNISESSKDAVMSADVIFLAVKPNVIDNVCEEIKDCISGKYIVSIAAGVTVSRMLDILGSDTKIVRSIPNLPAMVGAGITGIFYYNYNINDSAVKAYIQKLFEAFGKVVVVDKEKMIDEMISVTSSSPAYFCLMIEAMADAAVKAGFTRKDALIMAEQAMYGTAKLLIEKEIHPAVLKDNVCSPGGTTIEAVTSLEEGGFRSSIIKAMEACEKKAVRKEGYV